MLFLLFTPASSANPHVFSRHWEGNSALPVANRDHHSRRKQVQAGNAGVDISRSSIEAPLIGYFLSPCKPGSSDNKGLRTQLSRQSEPSSTLSRPRVQHREISSILRNSDRNDADTMTIRKTPLHPGCKTFTWQLRGKQSGALASFLARRRFPDEPAREKLSGLSGMKARSFMRGANTTIPVRATNLCITQFG